MITFTIHEPPHPAADRMDRAEELVFVKEGFTWSAALFTPFWLIAKRLWWPLAGYIIAVAVFEATRALELFHPGWITLASTAVHLLVGFEADVLQRWSLDQKGWRMVGSVSGKNAAECERRFFDQWLPHQPVIAPTSGQRPIGGDRSTPIIGSLFGARS